MFSENIDNNNNNNEKNNNENRKKLSKVLREREWSKRKIKKKCQLAWYVDKGKNFWSKIYTIKKNYFKQSLSLL